MNLDPIAVPSASTENTELLTYVYRCEQCGVIAAPRTPSHRAVIETREKSYVYRHEANTFVKEGKREKRDDPGGIGRETVREVRLCTTCWGVRTGVRVD